MSDPAIQPATAGAAASPLATLTTAANMAPSMDELIENYKDNFTSNLVKFVILTIIQLLILIYVFAGGGIAEITQNWPKYRCNPAIMPFAFFFGVDAGENFKYCMKNIFQNNAGAVLGPLYGIMASFTDIVGVISNVANSFRYLIANLLKGMERMMSSFRDRFQFILFQIRLSFLKILSLMGRLYSTFYAVVFMGLSALRAAQNVANNDLVRFLLEFCFDPATPIELADGRRVPLASVQIGQRLAAIDGVTPRVTSLFRFDGSKTPMVQVHGVVVSEKHYLYYKPLAHWIEAGQHPDAVNVPSLPQLCCLNTDTHTLRIGSTIFADYDESESPAVIAKTQRLAERMLNSGRSTVDKPLSYSLGLDGYSAIRLHDGTVVNIRDVKIGDVLKTNGRVLGIVKELCNSIVDLPGKVRDKSVAAGQLIWSREHNAWVRAGHLYPQRKTQTVLYHLITTNNLVESEGVMYRDYREVSAPEMEEAYAEDLSKKLNPLTVS
jgi:hypothetical protein